ncbi:glucose-6-phosphate isomerase family protein [Streptomyces sp. MMS24-I2-30]|uniref:glucose-6-phosphate isomerase family protein n=1 Tax=Streptomyces sp. MMS24-I2-30 TaxID=3351564 RepID=UPI003896E873
MTVLDMPESLRVDRATGVLSEPAKRYVKRVKDLAGLYLDEAAFAKARAADENRIVYWVDDFRTSGPGSLTVGTSVVLPGKVGTEYAMTRGHIHQVAEAAEVYHCVAGHGVLIMETIDGEVRAEEMRPDTIVYVPGNWIHRSVNVGSTPLITVFTYDAAAGQDYGIIERSQGLAKLVTEDGQGGWQLSDNPRYVSRDVLR